MPVSASKAAPVLVKVPLPLIAFASTAAESALITSPALSAMSPAPKLPSEPINVPPEMLPELKCLIRADIAGRPDPARTPVLTNGQTFELMVGSDLDRDFYVASVGWYASNVLAVAPKATIKITTPLTWPPR